MFGWNVAEASTFMPVQGTETAAQVDLLYAFLLWSSLIASALVIGGFIVFAIIYRRKTDNDQTAYISHNTTLEFLWSFVPFVIFMVVFGWGWYVYQDLRSMPKDALEIHVQAKKWGWSFTYKNGKQLAGEFLAPVGQPVKLVMTSKDVIHSFYIPAFRTKQDVIPGRYTALPFEAKKKGEYQVFCTEYCGDGHSDMLAKLKVVSQEEFEAFLQERDPFEDFAPLAKTGAQIYKNVCSACHSADPTKPYKGVGPNLWGIFGKERKFTTGATLVADENYLRESIMNPTAKIVETFTGSMPVMGGQKLDENQITALVEFIKALKE